MAIAFIASAVGSAVNGGNITLTIPASGRVANYCAVVNVGIGSSRATPTMTAQTSGGTNYTTIAGPLDQSGNSIHFAVFRRILDGSETTITVAGTGASSDSGTSEVMVFSGVDTTTPEDAAATTATGAAGTQPDSPSITVVTPNAVVISAVNAQTNDATITAPSSFLNQTNTNANDNWDSTSGMAQITITSSGAFDPGAWSNFAVGGAWMAASIALRPAAALTWFDIALGDNIPFHRATEITGY